MDAMPKLPAQVLVQGGVARLVPDSCLPLRGFLPPPQGEVAAARREGAGLAVLVVLASLRGDAWHIVSCSIYGATLVLLYAASTLYPVDA